MNTPEDYADALKRWDDVHQRGGKGPAGSIHCTVELFGAARLIARTRELSLELPAEATYAHVFAALAEKLPVLVGHVISRDGTSLVDGYACNVNGLHFVRAATTRVNEGDTIVILSADAGG
jgi:molybdopterin converting factor small subunit